MSRFELAVVRLESLAEARKNSDGAEGEHKPGSMFAPRPLTAEEEAKAQEVYKRIGEQFDFRVEKAHAELQEQDGAA